MEEVKNRLRALPQAGIVPGGDCGACCVAAVANVTVRDVYDKLGRTPDGLCYSDIIDLLWSYNIQHENFLPNSRKFSQNPEYFALGQPAWHNFIAWYDLSVQRMNRGLVGLSPVNFSGQANTTDDIDHFVIIYGYKKLSEAARDKLLYISCPTKGEFVVSAKDFLWHYGGYNTIWTKPK